jgi:hypothetical protein
MNDRFMFSDLLNKYLQQEERSASWLARKVEVHRSTVSRWIDGSTHPDTPDKVIKISRYLHLDQEETNLLLDSCNFPLLPPQASVSQTTISKDQLSVNLKVIEPVRVYSSYGLVYHLGGPCPPLEGHINLGMAVENHSEYPAKSIKVDLEVHLLEYTHPECNRAVYTSYDGWYHREYDRYYWHFRYDGTPDDVCLQEDDLPLGKVEFAFTMPKDSENFKNMENEDYTQLEATALKNPTTSLIKTGPSNEILQRRICRLYQKNPAEDTYLIKYKVRAENCELSEGEATFTVFWLNEAIPQLVISGQKTNLFDFDAYPDFSAAKELRAALLNEIPLNSPVDDVLSFLDENDIPRAPAGRELKYGFTDSLNTHNVILVVLKVRSSRRTQIISFIFDDSRHLEDIKVEFPF